MAQQHRQHALEGCHTLALALTVTAARVLIQIIVTALPPCGGGRRGGGRGRGG